MCLSPFLSCLLENLGKSFSFFKENKKNLKFSVFFCSFVGLHDPLHITGFFCLLKASFAFTAAFQNGSYSPKGDTPATSNFLLHFQRRLM